jgi:hypothetical protein
MRSESPPRKPNVVSRGFKSLPLGVGRRDA